MFSEVWPVVACIAAAALIQPLPSYAASVDTCSIATISEIRSVVHGAVGGIRTPVPTSPVPACEFDGSPPGPSLLIWYKPQGEADEGEMIIEQTTGSGSHAHAVFNLGKAATLAGDSLFVVTRRGGGMLGDLLILKFDGATATPAAAIALAKKIVARLPGIH